MNYVAGSFRERGARVFVHADAVYRRLDAAALDHWRFASECAFFRAAAARGQIVATRELPADELPELPDGASAAGVLEHARIPFVSYPYEWCFGMLRDAALLQLELLAAALREGATLKDASPYNVQFRGVAPTFIDISSFERAAAGEPWIAYRQFCELFLYPLLLQAYRGIDFQPLLRGSLDGLDAERCLRWFPWRDRLRPGVLTHVWLQAALARGAQRQAASTVRQLQDSGFHVDLILNNIRKLSRLIQGLAWRPPASAWTNYDETAPHVAADSGVKTEFVARVLDERRRELVWDLGCNRGRYARLAAERADAVVALDGDHACIERLYQSLKADGPENVLPLVVNLADPSPALGWRGRERQRLEERGRPDLVLCLGLIHHLVIAANVPLPEVVDWLASLGGEIVLEFPTKADPMVQGLLRNKADQYADYSWEALEAALADVGLLVERDVRLPSGERRLLHLVPRS